MQLSLLTAALTLTACSSDSLQVTSQDVVAAANQGDNSIQFGTYIGKSLTRAGITGEMTTDALKTGTAKDQGFGVFAYYGDNATYADASSTPNFMYNQQVKWTDTDEDGTPDAWIYAPVKYWPNEFGNTASSEERVDRLTFFAYAPFVNNDPATGAIETPGTSGIRAFVENGNDTDYKNTSTGDPRIKFTVDPDPINCVDLLWGVMPDNNDYEIANNPTDPTTSGSGLPWRNITKQSTSGYVNFQFKHALAKLKFTVDADVDDVRDNTSDDHSKGLADGTKIFVREVSIKGKIAKEGYLNLNNTAANTPLWEKQDGGTIGDADVTFTFYDGRTNGKEGYADASPATDDSGNSSSETVTGLNSALIQTATTASSPYTLSNNAGVTKTPTDLLTNNGVFYVIPTSSSSNAFEVEITYDVLTEDANLVGTLADNKIHGSLIKNNIKKTVNTTISAGNVYNFKLHLGMTSVNMEATVSEWDGDSSAEVDLPVNSTTPSPAP